MKDWYVGQMVVCIEDMHLEAEKYGLSCPKLNAILTIRSVESRNDPQYSYEPVICFLFEEIANEVRLLSNGTTGETAFDSKDFRPLNESRLDQFRVHLNPKKVEEKIDA